MKVTIAYHGHCFDGMASAAVLTRFLREHYGKPLELTYRGLDHQPGGSHVPEQALDGDVNAVVDFRYTTSEQLTWYFDHHVSGVAGERERSHLEADTSGRKFFAPDYGSCCKLIADVTRERFGFDAPQLQGLVQWADVIDAARFPDADTAVQLEQPALQLMTVIEAHGDDRFLAPRIRRLAEGTPLDEVAREHKVQKLLGPLRAQHAQTLESIRHSARCEDGVVTFELAGPGRDRYNKFIPYWLFPEARYSVGVSASPNRTKISVGSNPWAPVARTHDIAALCARHGGGGHPVVGGISLGPGELERARAIAADVVAALRCG